MKASLLFALGLSAAINSLAQPTLNSANSNLVLGDVIFNAYSDTPTISAGASGAGVTWDFRGLPVSMRDTTITLPCSSTAYCDSFPSSTFASFTKADSNYEYYSLTPAALEVVGNYEPVSRGGVDYLYVTMPYKFGPYRITYGSTWKDTAFEKYDVSGTSDFFHVLFAYNNNADAYGTLLTPFGTFTNVLRVHTIEYDYDTELYMGIYPNLDTIESYWWYKPGYHNNLMQISFNSTSVYGSSPVIKFSTMLAPTAVEYLPNERPDFKVYPNPAKNIVMVRPPDETIDIKEIELTDVAGRSVYEYTADRNQSNQEITLQLVDISPGFYLLRIVSSLGVEVRKIQIEP